MIRIAEVGGSKIPYAYGASELKQAYPTYIKIALLIAIVLNFLGISLFKLGGVLAARKPPKKVEVKLIPYAKLGPPPSLSGSTAPVGATPMASAAAAGPTIGVPVPVPDAEATVETGARQAELAIGAGGEIGAVAGAESVAVIPEEVIPTPEQFVAYDFPPTPVKLVEPEYPDICRKAGVEGKVFVQLLLDLDGHVMDARVAKSSGNAALDEAALVAGKQSLFTPAKQRDKPVRVWVIYPYSFQLRTP